MSSKNYFKNAYDNLPYFQTPITNAHITKILECCLSFETKNNHAQALNTLMLGVTPIYFTMTDINMFLDIFNINTEDIKRIISKSNLINNTWIVVADPYNQMVVYIAHRILTDKGIDPKLREMGLFSLFKLLNYKFFTSIVNHSYKYGADKATMEYVVTNMSNKFDLVKLGTWKKVLEERSKSVYEEKSIHYQTLKDYSDDEDIIYVLSDTQSRIRQKIVLFNKLYYDAKEKNKAISEYQLVDQIDGQKMINPTSNIFDSMISNLQQQIQTPSRFLDMEIISILASKFKDVNKEMLKTIIMMFCDLASSQVENKRHKLTTKIKNQNTGEEELVYLDCNLLLAETIQKTYRYCILSKTNMSSKASILTKVLNTYTSSRVIDKDILAIKRSFVYFVVNCNKSRRNSTIASLALAMIIYIIIKSFAFI